MECMHGMVWVGTGCAGTSLHAYEKCLSGGNYYIETSRGIHQTPNIFQGGLYRESCVASGIIDYIVFIQHDIA